MEKHILLRFQTIFDYCGCALLRSFDDRSENCRILAIICLQKLCKAAIKLDRLLPFLMSTIKSRYPNTSFDKGVDVFVHDINRHDFFKRRCGYATR